MTIPSAFRETLRTQLPFATDGELAETDDLAALGLDSMGVVQLLTAMEERFGLDLPDELVTEETFATVGSLWHAVADLIEPERLVDV